MQLNVNNFNDFANSIIGAHLGEEKADTHVNITEIKPEPKRDKKHKHCARYVEATKKGPDSHFLRRKETV